MTYAVIVERASAGCSAYAPDLPGCAATGQTMEEVRDEIREAIEFQIEGLREAGLPVPEPTSTAVQVDVRAA